MLTFGGWACAMLLHPKPESLRDRATKQPSCTFRDAHTFHVFRSSLQNVSQILILITSVCTIPAVPADCVKRVHARRCTFALSGQFAVACLTAVLQGSSGVPKKMVQKNQQLALLVHLCCHHRSAYETLSRCAGCPSASPAAGAGCCCFEVRGGTVIPAAAAENSPVTCRGNTHLQVNGQTLNYCLRPSTVIWQHTSAASSTPPSHRTR